MPENNDAAQQGDESNQNAPIVSIEQILGPSNSDLQDVSQPTQGSEPVILQSIASWEDSAQKNAPPRKVRLRLYRTHLNVADATTGELIEAIPLDQISKISRTLFFSNLLNIWTHGTRYRIGWLDRHAEPTGAGEGPQRAYTKNKQWLGALKGLRQGRIARSS